MPLLKTKDLLEQLSQLESSLNEFAYEALSTKEAATLKKAFSGFRSKVEQKIVEPNISILEAQEAPLPTKDQQANLFMAQISHEIRTPLNGIVGFTNLIKEEGLNASQLEKVLAIESASNYLMDIINEVLDYAKLSSGQETFKSVDFNVHGLLKDVLFLCRTLLLDKNVQLRFSMDPKVPQVLVGDPSKLSQVLLNLMGNAIKFVEKGHVSLVIAHKGLRNGYHELQFTVEDTGIGISKEQLKHIFERFQQVGASSSQKQEGTGLGLSIVKKIIEHQDGHIRVSSTVGEGTKFIFTIPYKEGKTKHIAPKNEVQQTIQLGKHGLQGTEILVFEDNALNQRLIEEQLKKWGCRTYITQDAEVGLDLLLKRPIDLVLMDLKMPGMTGFEIAQKIRSLSTDHGGQVPIVALSADFTAQDEQQCLSAGINDFLLKPYTLEALLTKVVQHKKEAQLPKESLGLLQKPVIQNEGKSPICLDPLLEDCFGKVHVLEELVRLLKQNIYEFIGSVKISMEAADYHGVALAAHKLKAGLSMVHADGLKAIVVELEENAKQNGGERVAQLYHDFLKALPAVEMALTNALNQLKNS